MPASRKRIGFLPSGEVQEIINKICIRNNLSQSKVTGILVEEALKARNLYGLSNNDKPEGEFLKKDLSEYEISKEVNFTYESKNIAEDDEYKLVKEYLNYKNFKKFWLLVQLES